MNKPMKLWIVLAPPAVLLLFVVGWNCGAFGPNAKPAAATPEETPAPVVESTPDPYPVSPGAPATPSVPLEPAPLTETPIVESPIHRETRVPPKDVPPQAASSNCTGGQCAQPDRSFGWRIRRWRNR